MRLSKLGQSPLELTLILTFVLVGIIIGGPYLLRSINAHFKFWENSTQDSLNDHFVQPPNDLYKLPTCSIATESPGACGVNGCKKTERAIAVTQTPATCSNFTRCDPDKTCCTIPLKGYCYGTPNDFRHPAPVDYSYTDALGVVQSFKSSNPLIGDRVFTFDCGPYAGLQVLQYDEKCVPCCLLPGGSGVCLKASNQPPNTVQCPGFGLNMIVKRMTTAVDQVTDCNPAKPCELYCAAGYYLSSVSHTCEPLVDYRYTQNITVNHSVTCIEGSRPWDNQTVIVTNSSVLITCPNGTYVSMVTDVGALNAYPQACTPDAYGALTCAPTDGSVTVPFTIICHGRPP